MCDALLQQFMGSMPPDLRYLRAYNVHTCFVRLCIS